MKKKYDSFSILIKELLSVPLSSLLLLLSQMRFINVAFSYGIISSSVPWMITMFVFVFVFMDLSISTPSNRDSALSWLLIPAATSPTCERRDSMNLEVSLFSASLPPRELMKDSWKERRYKLHVLLEFGVF